MKNISKFIAMAAVVIPLCIGCGQQSKDHLEEADENLTEAGKNLKEASKDADAEARAKAAADWRAFKSGYDQSIADMEKQANEQRARIAKADQKNKAKMSSDLAKVEQKLSEQKAKLNQKNAEFENDVANFNNNMAEKNETFKSEFKHDMDGLSNAFNDLLTDNVK